MGKAAQQTRTNRTITIDFQHEATYVQLLGDGKAFLECVLACILSLGFQLTHKATCRGGRCLTRHSHDVRIRLGGVTIWRLQCTRCNAVFTVLPHFILRYRQMRPEVAREALLATYGGLSLERCAMICHLSPMALYRLVCAFGHQSLGAVLTRCGLSLPVSFLADEKHSRCLTETVYLPTIVCGRVIWHLGYTEEASAAALTQSYGEFQRAASPQEPSYRVWGILSDGFDSTAKSRQTLFPGVRLGNCRRHAINKLPKQLAAIASPIRKALRSQFHTWLYQARQRKGLRVEGFNQGEFQPSSDVSVLPPIILPPLDRYAHLRERVERCRSVPSASVIGSSITAPLPASPRSFVGGVASSLPAPLHAGSHSR